MARSDDYISRLFSLRALALILVDTILLFVLQIQQLPQPVRATRWAERGCVQGLAISLVLDSNMDALQLPILGLRAHLDEERLASSNHVPRPLPGFFYV